MITVSLTLVSHTNAGKTSLARTLLGRDVGQVRDAPHVTESSEAYTLIESVNGPDRDALVLWDTPGFGDTVALAKRLKQSSTPLGWFLSNVWDRWVNRPMHLTQLALKNVRDNADLVLYLVNAAEPPESATYIEAEMEILAWMDKPVLVLLNQLGIDRTPEQDAGDVQRWGQVMKRFPAVKDVLPLDAFSRSWIHEFRWLEAVSTALSEGARASGPNGQQTRQAMERLQVAWRDKRWTAFDESMNAIADTLTTLSVLRVEVTDGDKSQEDAQKKLAADTAAEFTGLTSRLVALYDLSGSAVAKVEEFAGQTTVTQSPVGEKKAGVIGSLISGAAGGAAADLAAGGITLGAGAVIGAVLGAIGGFGGTRALNRMRGKTRSWVYWTEESMVMWAQTAIFRYLAVMHFGRGRGDWVLGDTPAHWRQQVSVAMERRRVDLHGLLSARSMDLDAAPVPVSTGAFSKVMRETSLEVLECLYGEIRGLRDPNRSNADER